MVKTDKSEKNTHLGDLLSKSLAAFGNPLVEAAPYRDRNLRVISRLLEPGELPAQLEEDQRQKIWENIYTALFEAE